MRFRVERASPREGEPTRREWIWFFLFLFHALGLPTLTAVFAFVYPPVAVVCGVWYVVALMGFFLWDMVDDFRYGRG